MRWETLWALKNKTKKKNSIFLNYNKHLDCKQFLSIWKGVVFSYCLISIYFWITCWLWVSSLYLFLLEQLYIMLSMHLPWGSRSLQHHKSSLRRHVIVKGLVKWADLPINSPLSQHQNTPCALSPSCTPSCPPGELPSGSEWESLLWIALHIRAGGLVSPKGSGVGLFLSWCKKHWKEEGRAWKGVSKSRNHRMAWVERDLKDHLFLTPSRGQGCPPSLDCPRPHPTWPGLPPGMGHHSFFGQLCQGFAVLWVEKIPFSLKPSSLVLSLSDHVKIDLPPAYKLPSSTGRLQWDLPGAFSTPGW